MTDEPREETQPEEKEDVEGHHGLGPEPALGHSDEDDEVEGHFGLGPEPSIGP
jgi:hypothetical protein